MQAPVKTGETFEYRFRLKDAGLFLFHPQVRAAEQVERGRVGVIRVRGPPEPAVDDERVLVLDDVKLNEDGTFPRYIDGASKMLGREAETLLVTGARNARIPVRPGALTRFRLINAANPRFSTSRSRVSSSRPSAPVVASFRSPTRSRMFGVAPTEVVGLVRWVLPPA